MIYTKCAETLRVQKLKNRYLSLVFVIILLCSLATSLHLFQTVSAPSTEYIPLKWGVIIMGGFDYYRTLTYNSIQRIEKIMLGRGVPYDLFQDDDIVAPTDHPPTGRHPLQFENGTLRYQVLVLLCDYEQNDTNGKNQLYIDWAIANGTNAVLFHKVAQFVPELLGLSSADVGWIWQLKITSCIVERELSDGIAQYDVGFNATIGISLQWHAIIHKSASVTLWFNKTWDTDWSVGMANTTYGKGNVWYLGWSWNDAFRMEDPSMKYINAWSQMNFGFWGHAINACFNNVERMGVRILPFKKWKGAWIVRFDTDHYRWEDYWIPPESLLKNGWVYDYQYGVLGYDAAGDNPLQLGNGAPDGYAGVPSSTVKWADWGGAVRTTGWTPKTFKVVVYNHTKDSGYDRIKIDLNENMDFSDDISYGMWENITYPTIVGIPYWCSIAPDFTDPYQIRFSVWQVPMLFASETTKERLQQYGRDYGLSYSFHGWQHQPIPDCAGTYGMWNGTAFINNATYIEEKLNAARFWMAYGFGPTGYGFEQDAIIISHPGDAHPSPVDSVIANLPWILFSYSGQVGVYWVGFAQKSETDKFELASSRTEYFYTESNITVIQEMVQTLYPVISTYAHNLNSEIFNSSISISFPPYSNSVKPANPREAFLFWLNSKYMLENTFNARYENGKVVLEYTANSTLEDYVWVFPLEHSGRYFNRFSDNSSIGKVKYSDGRNVYVEFSSGQGKQQIEVEYGDAPYVHEISGYVENMTQSYTAKNATFQIWNTTGSSIIKIGCTRLGMPDALLVNGQTTSYDFDPDANICFFNLTFSGEVTVQLLWVHAPPDAPTLITPSQRELFNPGSQVSFSWRFNDPDTGDLQTAYRFQLDDEGNFGSPMQDSGEISSYSTETIQSLPTAVKSYFWRVKTWDSQHAEGEWSMLGEVVVDQMKIALQGSLRDRIDVGTSTYVYFEVIRQSDGSVFDHTKGQIYINYTPATWDGMNKFWRLDVIQHNIGQYTYELTGIVNTENSITAFSDDVGPQEIIWDKVLVTMTASATETASGDQVNFTITATYAYDNMPVSDCIIYISRNGSYFATNNFTDIQDSAGSCEYVAVGIIEKKWGLKAFESNSVTVSWVESESNPIRAIIEWFASNAMIIVLTAELTFVSVLLLYRERRQRLCAKTSHMKAEPTHQ